MKLLSWKLALILLISGCTDNRNSDTETVTEFSSTSESTDSCTEVNPRGYEPGCYDKLCTIKPVTTCIQCPNKKDCCKKRLAIPRPD